MDTSNRFVAFDHIRIFACFSVVLLHVSAWFWYNRPMLSKEWLIADAYNIVTRAGVPLFVMISGALFLNPQKKITTGTLWKKHILRLFIIYLLWTAAYSLQSFLQNSADEQSMKDLFKAIFAGRYHLWFLPMLIGIYATIPILKIWVEDTAGSASEKGSKEESLRYFFLLFFLFQILFTSLCSFFDQPELLSFLDSFRWAHLCNYIGYFILGYYLFHIGISNRSNRLLWRIAPICYLGNLLISVLQNLHTGSAKSEFFDSFGVFTFFLTIAVFQFYTQKLKYHSVDRPSTRLLTEISKSTLGIYLIHLMVMESPWMRPLYALPIVIAIPIISILTFVISLIVATLLRKLPLIGRFIC